MRGREKIPQHAKNPFEYHKPTEEQIPRIETLRKAYFILWNAIENLTEPGSISGRYVSLARTALEESAMWATKSIVFEPENAGEEKKEHGH